MAKQKREHAKALFLQGYSLADIARHSGVSMRTIQRWMKADEENGESWKTLRSSLPKDRPPKVIVFDPDQRPAKT